MTTTKEKRKAYNAKYWRENKEKVKKHRKEVYDKYKASAAIRNKKWKQENKDRWNAYQREYRRRRKQSLVDKTSQA